MGDAARPDPGQEHTISVVVPVYRGERHLPGLVDELAPLTAPQRSPAGHPFRVTEVILVNDCGPDDSARVLRELAAALPWVRPVWLSRNFGQHAATTAGIASSSGDWVVTMDEDGQHDPADIGDLLDTAMRERSTLVYASPRNEAPHTAFRNTTSRVAKLLINMLSGGDADATKFHSFRLMLGEIGRSVAAYAGQGVYLDVALSWVADRVTTCPVSMRSEGDRVSGYSVRTLISHFWRMVMTSGTRGLRVVSLIGATFATFGVALAVVLAIERLAGGNVPEGWTSTVVIVLLCSGIILYALGIVAEYIGVAVNMAMGKPPYLIMSDPHAGPLGRDGRGT
ncbi:MULTISPECIES: glycosyltransferase family 2 protein [unclassified Isoptericola]|uniref:glycosyltransferase family 2 protein n=1 Tax=unclassified Isoptericola TaxID=2623355 RepID=UPI003661AC06